MFKQDHNMNFSLDNIAIGLLTFSIIMVIFIIVSIFRNAKRKNYIYSSLLLIPFFIGVLSVIFFTFGLVYPSLNIQKSQINIGYVTHNQTDSKDIIYIQTNKGYAIAFNGKEDCVPSDWDKHDEIKLVTYKHGNQKVKFPMIDISSSPVCDIISINK